MSKSKVITLLLMSLLAVSCGQKKSTSSVKLKLFQSSITTGADMSGGILLMGRSADGLNSFRTSVGSVNESLSLDLAKGRWEFAAVGWSSANGPMTGENRCAYTEFVDLKETDVNVTFNLSQLRCLTDFNGNQFSDSNYLTSTGKFLEFYPVMCNVNTAGDPGCMNSSNPTSIMSYKIIYKPEAKGLVTGNFKALSSNCLVIGSAIRARIPVTSDVSGSPLKVSISYFKSSTCDGNPELSYDFNNGIANNLLPVWNHVAPLSSYYSYLYLNPGIQFDMAEVNPGSFILNSGVTVGGGAPAFMSNQINYVLPALPLNVSEVCFTLESSCPVNKWIPVQLLTGNLMVDGGASDGNYVLKLFFKTMAQVVSSTHAEAAFIVDSTPLAPPVFSASPNASQSSVTATWSATDQSLFAYWKIYVCSDSSCSSVIGMKQINDFNTKYVTFTAGEITGGLILGQNYCVMVKGYDLFGRPSQTPPACVISTI